MPKILLVEDNEMNRDMLSRHLARAGYEVAVAEDGARGVEMASSGRPDLILPVIDGWEAMRRIKATPELRKIPIIALTAHARTTDRGPRGRLRRLRHKADRAVEDRGATRGCGTVDDLQDPDR